MPRVSIGLPVYNGQKYLSESIASLLSQSFEDFELIISDNASTDRTGEICRSFAEKDKRIRYYRNEVNLGAAPNYNRVAGLAQGTYFKWASHDDIHAPEHLARCVAMLDTAPASVVLCYPKTILTNDAGEELEKYEDQMDLRYAQPHARFRHVLRHLRLCNAVFGLIRVEVLKRSGLIGAYAGSDFVLMAELSLWGEFWEIPEYLFFRRLRPSIPREDNGLQIDTAAWFDSANKGKLILPQCRFFFEYIKAINRSPLTLRQKAGCYKVLMDEWVKKYWRHMGGECKMLLRYKLGLLRQN
jgi:glycosyltransferase involved in cell wall biosynthesis